MIRDANDYILEERLLESKNFVVVAFFLAESIPCRHFRPEFDALADMIPGNVEFWRVDVSENPEITDLLGIGAAPTTVLYRDSDEVRRFEGPYERVALRDRLKDAMLMRKNGGA
jgi:thioredoxin 1